MREFKASTKAGQGILRRAEHNEGYFLSDVYGSFSQQKENAWKWCENQYLISDRGTNFRICSHNIYGYTVAWECYYNEERVTRMETKDNTYIVYLER